MNLFGYTDEEIDDMDEGDGYYEGHDYQPEKGLDEYLKHENDTIEADRREEEAPK